MKTKTKKEREKERENASLTGCFIRGRMNGLRITVRGSYGGKIADVCRGDVIARRTRRAMARCHGNGFTRSAARQHVRFNGGSASRGWNARLRIQ